MLKQCRLLAAGDDHLPHPGGHPAQGECQRCTTTRQEVVGVPFCVCLRLGLWRMHAGGQGDLSQILVLPVIITPSELVMSVDFSAVVALSIPHLAR